jgi:hypothetical protein
MLFNINILAVLENINSMIEEKYSTYVAILPKIT